MAEKAGFDVSNYNLTPEEAGQAALVNEFVEALADGFQFAPDGFTGYKAGQAIVEAILKNKHSKQAVIVTLVKLAMANVFDELAEQAALIARQEKKIASLEGTVLKLKGSARK